MPLIILKKGPRILKGQLNDGMLLITLPIQEYNNKSLQILEYLDKNIYKGKIESILEKENESVISYSFTHLDKDLLLKIQTDLKNITADLKSNIFYNRLGDL